MPLKDRDAQRQYQLEWMWRRRLQWILDNGPCNWCGSTNDLQVSWRNPATKKVKVASIWSRSEENRAKLLADCQVLCGPCTRKKVAIYRAVKAAMSKEEHVHPKTGRRTRGGRAPGNRMQTQQRQ